MRATPVICSSKVVVGKGNSDSVALFTKFMETAIEPYSKALPIDISNAWGGFPGASPGACTSTATSLPHADLGEHD